MKEVKIRFENKHLATVYAERIEFEEYKRFNYIHLWVGDEVIMTKRLGNRVELIKEDDDKLILNFIDILK